LESWFVYDSEEVADQVIFIRGVFAYGKFIDVAPPASFFLMRHKRDEMAQFKPKVAGKARAELAGKARAKRKRTAVARKGKEAARQAVDGASPSGVSLTGAVQDIAQSAVTKVKDLMLKRGADEFGPDKLKPRTVQRLRRPDGSEIHVEMHGPESAPAIVMTHGWSLNSAEWCYARDELADQFQVITWDLPGLGESGGPANKDWSLEKLAADLHAVVALVGARPVVLVGHSIGGMITLTWCRLFPAAMNTHVQGIVIGQSTYINPLKKASMAPL
jgi:hypothetical protein